jgi:hypothetical protein
MLNIVPAHVAGTWKVTGGELTLTQDHQKISGTMTTGGNSVTLEGRVRGEELTFKAGETQYTGKVAGDRISGVAMGASAQNWSATR